MRHIARLLGFALLVVLWLPAAGWPQASTDRSEIDQWVT
jgi:hypothetical protein